MKKLVFLFVILFVFAFIVVMIKPILGIFGFMLIMVLGCPIAKHIIDKMNVDEKKKLNELFNID